MLGVPIDGPAYSFHYDNDSVACQEYNDSTRIHADENKHNALNYHIIWEQAVTAKISCVGKEDGMTNLADILTKVLSADQQCALC